MVAVKSLDVIAILRAKMFKAAVFVGMGNDVALVVGRVVAVPVIVVDVRNAIDAATVVLFNFRFGVIVALGRRGLGNTALIGVHVVVTLLPLFWAALLWLAVLFRALGKRGERDQQAECEWNSETNLHRGASS